MGATSLRAALEQLIQRHAYDDHKQLCRCGKSEVVGRRGYSAHVANRIFYLLEGPPQPEIAEGAAVGYGSGE